MTALVDATWAAYVVRGWIAEGWRVTDIARAADLPEKRVATLLRLDRKKIQQDTHDAITRLDEEDIDRAALFVDATDTRRILEHLQYRGHSQEQIASAAGTTKQAVSAVLTYECPRIRPAFRDAVASYYSAHRDEDGGSTRSHRLALRRGWEPIEHHEEVIAA